MPTLRPVSPPFVHRLRVRYHECDAQGIVFNAHHFAYFDVTLTELWREAVGSFHAVVRARRGVGVVDPPAAFHSSPRLADPLHVRDTIRQLGNLSMVHALEGKAARETLR